jgi:hypothetical protein
MRDYRVRLDNPLSWQPVFFLSRSNHRGSRTRKRRQEMSRVGDCAWSTLALDWGHHGSFHIASEFPHEAKIRLLRAERKIENEKLEQFKTKLRITANAKKSVMQAA